MPLAKIKIAKFYAKALFDDSRKFISAKISRYTVYYSVHSIVSMGSFAARIATEIKEKKTDCLKTVIFCRRYLDCANMYQAISHHLGSAITDPVGSPNLQQFRVLDIFTRASTPEMKERILASFCSVGTKLRVLVATTAFGMGIDCPDICTVVHWCPPHDVDAYVQESGRAGRDGRQAYACLMYGATNPPPSDIMKGYGCNVNVCRRKLLFKHFILGSEVSPVRSHCCDICDPHFVDNVYAVS